MVNDDHSQVWLPDLKLRLAMLPSAVPFAVAADPSLECSIGLGSQVEIADCVAETEASCLKKTRIMGAFMTVFRTDLMRLA